MSEPRSGDFSRTFAQPVVLTPEDTALVIIDMQYHDASADQGVNVAAEKSDPGCTAYYAERVENTVIPTIQELLMYCRANGVRVIYITLGSDFRDLRDVPERLRVGFRQLAEDSGLPDLFWSQSPMFAIREEIAPRADELIVRKTTLGAFNSTNLDEILRALGVRNLIVTGVSTNICVESTARDAADRGFGCVVVEEGTAEYDPEAHDLTLRTFHRVFGRVIRSASEVIASMEAASREPATTP